MKNDENANGVFFPKFHMSTTSSHSNELLKISNSFKIHLPQLTLTINYNFIYKQP